jgi:tryptophan 2,3-dioxygenase
MPETPKDAGNGHPIPSEVSVDRALTYGRYLKVEELLSLQQPRSEGPEHDEFLFIIIHQVYELWFRQILHELDYLRRLLEEGDTHRSQHTLKRVLTILKVLVAQLDILETMTPLEFLSFRERLDAASGFQSDQFRQLEFVLGHKRRGVMKGFPSGERAREALERRWEEPTLWDAFLRFLARKGHRVPEAQLHRDVSRTVEPCDEVQGLLVDVYRNDPGTAAVCEQFVDLDEGIQEWRYRHVKMVERTIGHRKGTGGSAGAGYLQTTLGAPLFPDLWAIRNRL